jgi:riboflavin synthase
VKQAQQLMFTGIVQYLAEVAAVHAEPPGERLEIKCPRIASRASIGDSIAVNGCCLTVVQQTAATVAFEAGAETLSRTNLGRLSPGSKVNLEGSLRVGDPLGGHLVTGHIDAVATVLSRVDDGAWTTMWFEYPPYLAGELVRKGSIAVDGVSLTLVEVENDRFSVALIPHTLSATTLGAREPGDHVNIETDILGKYVARQLAVATCCQHVGSVPAR